MNIVIKKEDINVASSQAPSRNTGSANASMRKYQQLALALITAVSLTAFLFYKHEYDRLHYTLQYLDTFGSHPKDEFFQSSCILNVHSKISTAPSWWTKVSSDLLVYSTFWDEGNGMPEPVLRTIAVVKKSDKPQGELLPQLFYESTNKSETGTCSLEKVNYHKLDKNPDDITLALIVCKTQTLNRNVPYMIKYKSEELSPPMYIQESENWKSVPNISAVCVYSSDNLVTTKQLIEFISYHHIVGIEKFVFYGTSLTPSTRKLLDKYSDELGIAFEEKQFDLPIDFHLDSYLKRKIIELDCTYRHRNIYENVITLKFNEFFIPRNKVSLIGVLKDYFANKGQTHSAITEFHLLTQHVCIDEEHKAPEELLLSSQLHLYSSPTEEGVSIVHPHLSTSYTPVSLKPLKNEQHIPFSVAGVFSFRYCSKQVHKEADHIPTYWKFAELVKQSLLYRKLNTIT